MGKKLLLGSTVGLSQYFMSHVVKGSTVNVSIFMTECNDGDAAINHHGAFGSTTTTTTTRQPHHPSSTQKSCQEDIFSCFSHPLLLPPDGLCSSTDRCTSSWRRNTSDNNSILCTEEPSKVGASLLSAIKAKNSSSATDFLGSSPKNKNKTVADVSLAMTPVVVARSNSDGCEEMPSSSDPNNSVKRRGSFQRKGRGGQEQDVDVLAYCSSRGYMKVKNIPSELSRAPSTISMRRMILDKSESTTITTAAGTAVSPSRSHSNQRISWNNTESGTNSGRSSAVETHGGIATSSSPATFRRGMSMRIQMELVDTSNNSNTACPTPSPLPFSRSPSIPSTIDDKIRRGLKKRFARSWVTWAESWCMRVWEEEEAERMRKKALGVAIPPIDSSSGTKRNKVNVRPSVRRIGDPKCPQLSVKEDNTTATTTTSSTSSLSRVSSKDEGWKEMHVRRSPTRKNERWMSMEREDECGVEVECTVAIPQQHNQQKQKRRLKAVDINQNTEQESTKAATKRTGLLKHRRPKIK